MSSVKTWSSSGTKDSYSKGRTVTYSTEAQHEVEQERRGCLSWMTSTPNGWKPLSLSAPILLALVILTLLIAATIELLAQRSASQGGLAISPSLDAIPRYAMWSYLYGPNVVAVLYSLIWSWVDLDVKRMQPWFELSRDGGATAEGSLFLDYPYDFVASAPYKAFKRRHWPVFLGGTAMMIVFWAITPLQSAILGTGTITLTEPATVYARSRLAPVEDHVKILDPEFLNNGYAVGWLGQSMPPFITEKNGHLPFYIKDSQFNSTNITWSAATTRYHTKLDCWPADVRETASVREYDFLNGQGCNTTVNINNFSNYTMLYIGYESSPYASFALRNPACPLSSKSDHQFLAVWAQPYDVSEAKNGVDGKFNITALFCEPRYYKQQVKLKVDKATLQPIAQDAYTDLGPMQMLGEDEFNSTAFEFLLHSGVVDRPLPRDYPFVLVVEQHPRLKDANFTIPVSNMVGYAYSRDQRPAIDYGDPKHLQEAYSKAHEYLFSLAVSQLLLNDTSVALDTAGEVTVLQVAITVSRPLSAAVEVLLLLVAIMTATLAWQYRSCASNLRSNPSSLARLGEAFRDNPALVARFSRFDSYDDKALLGSLQHVTFELTKEGKMVASGLITSKDHEGLKFGETPDIVRKTSETERYYDPVRPWALRSWFGVIFMAVLAAGIAVLGYFKHLEVSNTGIVRPSDNIEVLQLLENYIPTMFATLMEPLWVLLTRLLCVLQPFRELWKGKAKARSSVDATYTSIPPQLVFWRAVRSRHWLLGIVCAVAFLANFLTVGLGAVFNEAPITIESAQDFRLARAARFDNDSVFDLGGRLRRNRITTNLILDHMYVALSNMTYSTRLPPWTTPDFFFQPVAMNVSLDSMDGDAYTFRTRGFGAIANCTTSGPINLPTEFSDNVRNPNEFNCPDSIEKAAQQMRETNIQRTDGKSAIEYCNTIIRAGNNQTCDRELTLGWGRMERGQDKNSTAVATFVNCRPILRSSMFKVRVDPQGYVLAYDADGKDSNTLDYNDAGLHIDTLFIQVNQALNRVGPSWRNGTVATDWFNYLLTLSKGSRTFLDPTEPPPDPETMLPGVEDIYRRQFAILLSLSQQLFAEADDDATIPGLLSRVETRIFMNFPSLVISFSVLGLNLLVAICFYLRSAAFVLPRMPTTLGSTLAFIAPSRWVLGIPEGLNRRTLRFGFGRFIGHDKQSHVGVEIEPYVVSIDPASVGQRTNRGGLRLRNWHRQKQRGDGDWL